MHSRFRVKGSQCQSISGAAAGKAENTDLGSADMTFLLGLRLAAFGNRSVGTRLGAIIELSGVISMLFSICSITDTWLVAHLALTIGAIGGLTLRMKTRAARGHTA